MFKHPTRALLAHLDREGWTFVGARAVGTEHLAGFDYTTADAMLSDLDIGQDVFAYFSDGTVRRWLLLIPSNGEDVLSDWGTAEGWCNVLETFLDGVTDHV